jgi:hypothetical protein
MFERNKDCPFSRFECFEHVNFAISEKYSKLFYDNPNYFTSM